MDLRQIQYFTCVYEEQNITRAAAKLHVVQPAVSMQIKKLEEELGTPMFERTARGVTPTPAGRAVYELYRPIMLDLRAARQSALELAGGVFGKLSIGIALSVANSVLGLTLSQYRERFPKVEVCIEESASEALMQKVVAGELDLAVVNTLPRRHGVNAVAFVREELVLVRRQDIGEDSRSFIQFDELAKMTLILPNSRSGYRSIVDARATEVNLDLLPMLSIDSPNAALDLVATNPYLAAILPASSVRNVAGSPFRLQRIGEPALTRELTYIHRSHLPVSPPSREFLQVLKAELTRACVAVGGIIDGQARPAAAINVNPLSGNLSEIAAAISRMAPAPPNAIQCVPKVS